MKKVLTSLLMIFLSLSVLISSINAIASSADELTVHDTVAVFSASSGAAWGSGAKNPTFSAGDKIFRLECENNGSYINQFQCMLPIKKLKDVVEGGDKIMFDIYPVFTTKNATNKCYLKYAFGAGSPGAYSGDFDHELKSGEVYTLSIDTSKISTDSWAVYFQFQNYGDNIKDDAVIMGTVPYLENAAVATTVSEASTSQTGSNDSGISGGEFDPNDLTFKDTVVSMTKGWEAGCSLIVDISKKFCTFTPYETSSHYTQQFQGYLNLSKFSDLIASTTQIAFDVYPTFSNQSQYDKNCYLKYSFDQKTFSGDFENALKSGQKYTLVINSNDIPSEAKAVNLVFQNYGSQVSDDATMIVSAPYAYGTIIETTTQSTTPQPTQIQPANKDFPAYNASKAYFRINNVNAYTGKLVEVPIAIGNNPGIFSAKLNIKYDKSVLTFKSIKPGTVFTASEMYYGPTSSDVLNIAFESAYLLNNNPKNGVIATLVFEVNTNAKLGSTPISFANYDESDYISCEAEKVPFTFGNGSVNVMAAPKVLSAPSKITVTQVSNKKAVISWNTVSGAKGYEIFRKVNSGKWTSYKTIINAKTKSFAVNSLAAGKTYSYKVRAFSSELVSNFTAAKTIKTYKLSQVKKVKSKVKGKTVTLSFSKTSNAQQYQVYVSTKKSSGYKRIKTVKTNKATIKLKAKKKYYIKVRALRKVGTSKQTVYGKYSVVKSIKTK